MTEKTWEQMPPAEDPHPPKIIIVKCVGWGWAWKLAEWKEPNSWTKPGYFFTILGKKKSHKNYGKWVYKDFDERFAWTKGCAEYQGRKFLQKRKDKEDREAARIAMKTIILVKETDLR